MAGMANLPDGVVPDAGITVVGFLDAIGGDPNYSTILGLMQLAGFHLMRHSEQPDDDN